VRNEPSASVIRNLWIRLELQIPTIRNIIPANVFHLLMEEMEIVANQLLDFSPITTISTKVAVPMALSLSLELANNWKMFNIILQYLPLNRYAFVFALWTFWNIKRPKSEEKSVTIWWLGLYFYFLQNLKTVNTLYYIVLLIWIVFSFEICGLALPKKKNYFSRKYLTKRIF